MHVLSPTVNGSFAETSGGAAAGARSKDQRTEGSGREKKTYGESADKGIHYDDVITYTVGKKINERLVRVKAMFCQVV